MLMQENSHSTSLISPSDRRVGSESRAQRTEANRVRSMVPIFGQSSPAAEPATEQSSTLNGEETTNVLSPRFQVGGRLRPRHRRRAATACQLCRARKTKCDNGRPSCGYCLFQGARCNYTDKPSGLGPASPPSRHLEPAPDHDVSNKTLLQRINHLTGLVQELRSASGARSLLENQYALQLPQPIGSYSGVETSHIANGAAHIVPGSAFTDDGFGKLEITELAARTSACESILRWPILKNVDWNENITSFALQSAVNTELPVETVLTSARSAVHEDRIWPLCRKFLVLIHVKNPILEVAEFKRYAREAAEVGPSWDGRGCLVVSTTAV